MHLGQAKDVSEVCESGVEDSVPFVSNRSRSFASEGARFVTAAIAAFSIVVNGGLIPQARHGGNGVEAVAVAGSKLEGTGLENEQIGQIHVAFTGFGAGDAPREICRAAKDGCAGEETLTWVEIVPCGCPRP